MVKRRTEEDVAGVLEFEGRTEADLQFLGWLAEHRSRNGGKIRVSKGATGIRVMFSKKADMVVWEARMARES